ncbi:MAG: WD40 repeat domain-containing protein [Gemmataceae bacterium]
MMRYLSLCLFAFPISIHAGEKAAFIPLRYEGLNETKLLRLKEVLGHPEMTAPVGHTAVLSADGKLGLFVGGGSSDADGRTDESFLSLWDVPGGHALKEIRIPGKAVSALALAPDGKTALTGLYGNDGKGNETTDLVLWSFETGKALHRFEAPKRKEKEQPAVYIAVAFAPDGKRALASVTRGGVQLVDLEKRKVAATLLPGKEETGPALALLFPSNEHAVVGWGAEVHLWDLAKNVSRKSFSGNKEPVLSVALSADGKRLATASVEGVVRYWDTSTGKELSSLSREPSNNPLVSIAFAGANLLTVWTGADPATGLPSPGSVALWDPEAKKEIWKRKATLHGLVPIAVTGTEATLGGGANIFCRWDMKAGVEQKIWGGHKTPVTAVAVLKSGQVVSGGQDGVLKYWHSAARSTSSATPTPSPSSAAATGTGSCPGARTARSSSGT